MENKNGKDISDEEKGTAGQSTELEPESTRGREEEDTEEITFKAEVIDRVVPDQGDSTVGDEVSGESTRFAVGVRFQPAGKLFLFNPGKLEPELGRQVVVEAERGLALGKVVLDKHEVKLDEEHPLKHVVRIADKRDLLILKENEERNAKAMAICKKKIETLSLPMKMIKVEYQHSANKAVFYFSADGRVDFRELVRMLAQELHIRVEMRQVGIRDEAKLIGGIGPCGKPTCCSTFLDNFSPVSIRMAKEQNLTLNPEKVSGLCGRLMCCLAFESKTYADARKGLPKIGKKTDTWRGRGRVLEINIFSNQMRLELEDREYISVSLDDYKAFKQDPEGFKEELAKRESEDISNAVGKTAPYVRKRSTQQSGDKARGAGRKDEHSRKGMRSGSKGKDGGGKGIPDSESGDKDKKRDRNRRSGKGGASSGESGSGNAKSSETVKRRDDNSSGARDGAHGPKDELKGDKSRNANKSSRKSRFRKRRRRPDKDGGNSSGGGSSSEK